MGVFQVAPKTSDGKPIFLPNLFPGPVQLYIAGSGDHATNGRGMGQAFVASSDVEGDTVVEWGFNDWLYLAGGGIQVKDGEIGDYVEMTAYCPATPVTPNGSNTGNCNLVDPGVGSAILIVPAAGDGAYDVDLAQANLVPAHETYDESNPAGYWEWTAPEVGKGTITAGDEPSKEFWHLFAVDIQLAKFVAKLPLMGTFMADITVPAVKPKKILPHWKMKVTLHNGGHTGLKLAWYLVTARKKTTT